MVATSIAELESMLMNRLQSAMSEASSLILTDMQQETSAFYSQGSPKIYKRTGTLGNTPKVSPLSGGGKQISFKAYLDKSRGYRTGTFSMSDVLTNAEAHTAGILGKPNFWANSEKRMKNTLDKTMRSFFR